MIKLEKYIKYISKKIDKPLICYDCESSGLSENDQIISLAAIKISPSGEMEEFTFICKPTCPIHPKASEVNGFTEEFVSIYPTFDKFVDRIAEFFKDADLCGYNISRFDNIFLERQMAKHGHPEFLKDRRVYDSFIIYSNHINKKLAGAVNFYTGKEAKDLHDALVDVKYTLIVTSKQLEKENKTLAEVLSDSDKKPEKPTLEYIIYNEDKEPVLNFSKHKGTLVSKVDKGFIKWVLSKEFPQCVKTILKEYAK